MHVSLRFFASLREAMGCREMGFDVADGSSVDDLRTRLGCEYPALQPLIGTVEAIQAIPWAKVYLGNRLLGETPLTAVRLPAGEQRLRFVNEPLGVDQVKIIVVRPGDNPKVIVPMTGSGHR